MPAEDIAPPAPEPPFPIASTPSLSFSDKCLGDQGVQQLVTALQSRRDVTSIDLRGNNVQAAGAAALCQLLMGSGGRIVGALSLEWNSLGVSDAAPRALARALSANASLTHLDLRNNRIGASGIVSLAEGLHTNSTLVTLDLRWNAAGIGGAHALEAALHKNTTLLRLPLQGNRVPDDALKRITSLLARNGSAHGLQGGQGEDAASVLPQPPAAIAGAPAQGARGSHAAEGGQGQPQGLPQAVTPAARASAAIHAAGGPPLSPTVHLHLHGAKENEPFGAGGAAAAGGGLLPPQGVASGVAPVTPLREAVHSRTLESALVVQQAEFSNKLKHAQQRADSAEETVHSERSRAEAAAARRAQAEEAEAAARQKLSLMQQELTASRSKQETEVAAARTEAMRKSEEAALALAAKQQLSEELEAKDRRLKLEQMHLEEREARAKQAEARASETATQLNEANERLLAERRQHAAELVALQDRLSDAEGARTQAELRLASADAARAAAIADALSKQSARYESAQVELRNEMGRLEEASGRAEKEKEALRGEIERIRSEGEQRMRTAEAAASEREARLVESCEARLESAANEKEQLREGHREALQGLREAEEARWAAHEGRLAQQREAHAVLERQLHEAVAGQEAASRDLARAQSEAAEHAHTEAALRDQIERQRQAIKEQAEALNAELAQTRRHWEGRLSAATTEAHTLSTQLVETQRQLQASNSKWETSVQGLQHSVLTCFQQSLEASRASYRHGPPTDADATADSSDAHQRSPGDGGGRHSIAPQAREGMPMPRGAAGYGTDSRRSPSGSPSDSRTPSRSSSREGFAERSRYP